MKKVIRFSRHLFPVSLVLCTAWVITDCGSTSDAPATTATTTTTTTTNSVQGTVSAGPLNGATVTAYTLNADGSQGTQLATATTDSNGAYTLDMPVQSDPVVIIASGGSYTEESSGTTVSMGNAQIRTLLPKVTAGQQVGVTPVTEIAAQAALAAVSSNATTSLATIIDTHNQMVASAMGVTDITQPPATPTQVSGGSVSQSSAQYALVLASISQLAQTAASTAGGGATVSSLDVMQALASSYTYNGSFTSSVGSQNVAIPTSKGSINLGTVFSAAGGSDSFSSAMSAATTTYAASAAGQQAGFSNSAVAPPPTFVSAPTAPTGAPSFTPPPAPTILPVSSPTLAGPPPIAGAPISNGAYHFSNITCGTQTLSEITLVKYEDGKHGVLQVTFPDGCVKSIAQTESVSSSGVTFADTLISCSSLCTESDPCAAGTPSSSDQGWSVTPSGSGFTFSSTGSVSCSDFGSTGTGTLSGTMKFDSATSSPTATPTPTPSPTPAPSSTPTSGSGTGSDSHPSESPTPTPSATGVPVLGLGSAGTSGSPLSFTAGMSPTNGILLNTGGVAITSCSASCNQTTGIEFSPLADKSSCAFHGAASATSGAMHCSVTATNAAGTSSSLDVYITIGAAPNPTPTPTPTPAPNGSGTGVPVLALGSAGTSGNPLSFTAGMSPTNGILLNTGGGTITACSASCNQTTGIAFDPLADHSSCAFHGSASATSGTMHCSVTATNASGTSSSLDVYITIAPAPSPSPTPTPTPAPGGSGVPSLALGSAGTSGNPLHFTAGMSPTNGILSNTGGGNITSCAASCNQTTGIAFDMLSDHSSCAFHGSASATSGTMHCSVTATNGSGTSSALDVYITIGSGI